jgi:hypothetical protein
MAAKSSSSSSAWSDPGSEEERRFNHRISIRDPGVGLLDSERFGGRGQEAEGRRPRVIHLNTTSFGCMTMHDSAKCKDAKCKDAKCKDAKCKDAKCKDAKHCKPAIQIVIITEYNPVSVTETRNHR